ncbi:MAG: phenylalanine--tRNA ligase subunit alpha [Coxiellaceae bacterium]|jgi:phenylalanyl-tRNA synthetase alpha chain|nr:phenylalanine--tRNA ligase subunit alpha [Coxiellaceae bacterium]
MKFSLTDAEQLLNKATYAIKKSSSLHELESVKSVFLGKKGKIAELLQQLITLDKVVRPKVGCKLNLIKEQLIVLVEKRRRDLKTSLIDRDLEQESIDVTLPSRGQCCGSIHPITKIQHFLEDIFVSMGFTVVEGPEIENEFYNFTALNIPHYHPARTNHDTFYFENDMMLRSQTSPVQIRAMQMIGAPLRIICPGKVYRRDNDSTHSPMFHQLEMLMVDRNLSLANLKWIIGEFIRRFFKRNIEYRFRPSYFPFTEPSAEVDIKWKINGSWRWLELGGCGVVHPSVLRTVNVDSKKFKGLAFGFGIDRLAMSYYEIEDIRMLFENDLQFLEQF